MASRLNRMELTAALVALALLAAVPVFAQARREAASGDAVRAEAVIAPDAPTLADEPTLTLTVRHPASYTLTPPVFAEKYGDFTVTARRNEPPALRDDVETTVFVLALRPDAAGKLVLPPLPLTLTRIASNALGDKDKNAPEKIELTIPPGTIEVGSRYAAREVSSADLSSPSGLFRSFTPIGIALAVLAVLAILAAVLVLRRSKASVAAPGEQPTALETARRELDELMDSKLYEHNVKEFYLRITDIVRRFIEKATGVRAPDHTTEEFLREITHDTRRRELFRDELRARLRRFLEFADLVKFAKFKPTAGDIFEGYRGAKEVIEYPFDENGESDGDGAGAIPQNREPQNREQGKKEQGK